MCVCVCVCARACACMCVCVYKNFKKFIKYIECGKNKPAVSIVAAH